MSKYIFPTIMIMLNLGQMLVMLFKREYITSVYWFSAALLNLTVTLKQ